MWRASGGHDPLPLSCRAVTTTPLALGWEEHPACQPLSCEALSHSEHLSFAFSVFLWVRKLMSLSPGGGAVGLALDKAGFKTGTVPGHTRKLFLVVRHVAVCIQWPSCSLHPGGLAPWASCLRPAGGFPHSSHPGPQRKQGSPGGCRGAGPRRREGRGIGMWPPCLAGARGGCEAPGGFPAQSGSCSAHTPPNTTVGAAGHAACELRGWGLRPHGMPGQG